MTIGRTIYRGGPLKGFEVYRLPPPPLPETEPDPYPSTADGRWRAREDHRRAEVQAVDENASTPRKSVWSLIKEYLG